MSSASNTAPTTKETMNAAATMTAVLQMKKEIINITGST
jgi:hypothetical protein